MTTPTLTHAPVVSLHDVVVVHGDDATAPTLDRITLEIKDGDRLALLGRSGSGKTTLLHVLGGLTTPTAGTVEWKTDSSVGSHAVAYVFQGANLLPHFTAFENVVFAATLTSPESDALSTAEELLRLVGLNAKSEHLPAELSGGEAQRVALARALAQKPRLLLCDEPTGHLDTDTAGRVLDLIDALQSELRFSLVIATHDVDVAARLGDQLELEDGRIVERNGR